MGTTEGEDYKEENKPTLSFQFFSPWEYIFFLQSAKKISRNFQEILRNAKNISFIFWMSPLFFILLFLYPPCFYLPLFFFLFSLSFCIRSWHTFLQRARKLSILAFWAMQALWQQPNGSCHMTMAMGNSEIMGAAVFPSPFLHKNHRF